MSTASTFKPDRLLSGKRGFLFIIILAVNFIVWLDVAKFGLLNPFWSADLGLTTEQIAQASASYLLGYFPMLLLAGVLSDRFGAKKMLIICVVGVTVLSASMALVQNYDELYWRNLIFGVFFGFLWAPSQRIISSWYPGSMSPKATAVWMSSTLLPGICAPLIAYPLATAFGWREAFFVIAALGVPALVLLIIFVADVPEKLRGISAVETAAIRAGFDGTTKPKLSVREVLVALKKPSIVTMGIATAFATSATWLSGTWLPYGLITIEKVDPNVVALATPLIGLVPVGVGLLHGKLVERFFKSRTKPWLIIGPLCGVVGYGFAALFPGSPWFIWAFMIAGFAYLCDPFFWGTVNGYWAGIARPEVTGTLNGIAAALQVAVGWFIVSNSGSWIDTGATGLAQLSPIWWVGAGIFAFAIIPVLISKEVRLRKISADGSSIAQTPVTERTDA
jgi:MFS family permease